MSTEIHIETTTFNRSRYSDFLAFLDSAAILTPREIKIIWLFVLCFQLTDLLPLPHHSIAAPNGLKRLLDSTDPEYVTNGNPELLREIIDHIKTATYRHPFQLSSNESQPLHS